MNQLELENRIIFNWNPASYIHHSWLESWLTKEQIQDLMTSSSLKNMNLFLREEFELGNSDNIDHKASSLETILMASCQSDIEQYALYVGATVYNEEIKRIICGKTLSDIKSKIGEAVYHFSIHKAPFLTGNLTLFKDYVTQHPFDVGDPLFDLLFEAGMRSLGEAAKESSNGFVKRLVLKLAASHETFIREGMANNRSGTLVLKVALTKLIAEINEQ